jgi:hypothetical protein
MRFAMTPPRSVGSAAVGSPSLALTEIKSFGGIRLTLRTKLPFDQVLARFRAQVSNASVPEIVRLATESPDEHTFAKEIEARYVGKSDFMLFAEINHGGWIARFGIQQRALRLIFGNPLIAITMIREEITAGLFVPVEAAAGGRSGRRHNADLYPAVLADRDRSRHLRAPHGSGGTGREGLGTNGCHLRRLNKGLSERRRRFPLAMLCR